jgi:hypothetical protein
MRRDDHLFKTMSAAKICIAECLKAPSPHDSLEKHLAFLRSDSRWSEAEIAEVETTARKAIGAAVARNTAVPNCGWPLTAQPAAPVARS